MDNLLNTEFKRKFSVSLYKNLKLKLGEMTFFKDFVNDTRGDLYPVIMKTDDCVECVENNLYKIKNGKIKRVIGQFFPYATYEIEATTLSGTFGFSFVLPDAEASLLISGDRILYSCKENGNDLALPDNLGKEITMIVSCRPGAFDVYFKNNGKAEYYHTFEEKAFQNSNFYSSFTDGKVLLSASGAVEVKSALFYIDNGVSIADMRPIRYENGDVMMQQGKAYITASIRMQEGMFQGVFSWIPGTAELDLTGAMFYDTGDGKWCGDVAASVLYHRTENKWYLWVCSFSHGHILGHSVFEGDPRFGVNAIDITLMNKADERTDISEFLGFSGDEDPDFYYDSDRERWLMAICRIDPSIKSYRYFFYESETPFYGYRCIGKGLDGAETGGSFVRINGERFFVCGNDFNAVSDYRIYHGKGMKNAEFDCPDGGFRGWGTLMPIKMGSRTRYFWLTFDRHKGSDYNWSYGNIYCFEAP